MWLSASERGYWILDLHPKAWQNADLRGRPNGTEGSGLALATA